MLWSVLCENVQVQSVFIVFFFFFSGNQEMNKLLLASGFVQQLFVLFSQGEPLCGFVQEAALLEKMSSQAHVDSAQQPIDCCASYTPPT